MNRVNSFFLLPLLAFLLSALPGLSAHADEKPPSGPQYAIALHGKPKYPPDFKHLDYVNPAAPKGGTLRVGVVGTFDSLNPFLSKGVSAAGLTNMRSYLVYESLMQNAFDEPFSLYGIIAKSIEMPEDRGWVRFELREEAKWNDGVPISADDVVWTFETLTTKGEPFFKAYWGDVESVTADGPKTVTFKFKVKGNAELPLIIAEMAVLPKHYWTAEGRNFEDSSSLTPPLTSGPYTFGKVSAPRSIEYVRNPNWWGKDLPFFKGMNNYERIVFDYYMDEKVAHQAFLSGEFDYKNENNEHLWQTTYDVPAVKDGRLIKELINHTRPAGMQAFAYNTRRAHFADVKVREALAYALDFEWSNKQLAFGAYTRTNSYFANSDLASSGLPSAEELKILEPFRGKIPEEVFTTEYKAPVTDGSGNARANLKKAADILEAAGYVMGPDKVRVKQTEKGPVKLEFEILLNQVAFERWTQPFIQNLARIGVKAKIRTLVDAAQYQNRLMEYDFDMIVHTIGQSDSPGNEQREYWGSDKVDIPGARNHMGVKDPVVDEIVTQLIHATSREDLITKTRALDRVLLWNHYVIPMWHYDKWRMAYWKKLKRPQTLSGIAPLVEQTWWIDPAAQEAGTKPAP